MSKKFEDKVTERVKSVEKIVSFVDGKLDTTLKKFRTPVILGLAFAALASFSIKSALIGVAVGLVLMAPQILPKVLKKAEKKVTKKKEKKKEEAPAESETTKED
jgi:hypothetical protein